MEYFLIVMLAVSSYVDSSSIDSFSSAAQPSRHKRDVDEKPWERPYLPNTIEPTLYNLYISPRFYFTGSHFIGQVSIEMNILNRTNFIIVHAKQLKIKRYKIYSNGRLVNKTTHFSYERNEYWVFQTFVPLYGRATLEVFYSGIMTTVVTGPFFGASGMFKIPFFNSAIGRQSWLLVTDFHPSNARFVFPCFDEPRFKAQFKITIQYWNRFDVLSNMPEERHLNQTLHIRKTTFKLSPRMSSYQVAFAITDFRFKEKIVNGTQYRVWARHGLLAKVDYALDVTPTILNYLQQELDIPYSLEKLDQLAVPGEQWTGQRDNWGLITYKESKVLINLKKDGDSARYEALKLIAHAMAHYYFGNLVTCRYWDHIWLNEGLATFYEIRAVTKVDPTFSYNEYFYGKEVEVAMNMDANNDFYDTLLPQQTHLTPSFDFVRREKGAAIIRMIEKSGFVVPSAFKRGIRQYLKRNANGTVVTDDLLEWMQRENGFFPNIRKVMSNWINKKGIPVVKIELYPGGVINATQKPFLMDPQAVPDHTLKWDIVLWYRTKRDEIGKEWLIKSSARIGIGLRYSLDDWVVFNYDRIGYYRVNYDENLWDLLAKQLNANHTVFSELTRAMLLSDAVALAKAEQLSFEVFLALTRYAPDERGLTPWLHIYEGYNELSRVFKTTSFRRLQTYLLGRTSKLMDKLQVKDEGTYIEKQLRPKIMSLSCSAGHKGCIDDTTQAFKDWIQNQNTEAVPENCHREVYCIGIANSEGDSEWNTTYKRYRRATSKEERTDLLRALSCTKNVKLLERLLNYAISDSIVDDNIRFDIVTYVAANPYSDNYAWKWLKRNYQEIDKTRGHGFAGFFLPHAVENFNSRPQLVEVRRFCTIYTDVAEEQLQLAEEYILANIRWVEKHFNTVAHWLRLNVPN